MFKQSSVILVLAALVACSSAISFQHARPFQIMAGGGGYKFCTPANSPLQIGNLTITPVPPVIGQTVSIQGEGSLATPIQGGNIKMAVSYYLGGSWQPLPTFNFDICTVSTCPIPAGPANINQQISIPGITPAGFYKGQLTVTDNANNVILCAIWQYELVRK